MKNGFVEHVKLPPYCLQHFQSVAVLCFVCLYCLAGSAVLLSVSEGAAGALLAELTSRTDRQSRWRELHSRPKTGQQTTQFVDARSLRDQPVTTFPKRRGGRVIKPVTGPQWSSYTALTLLTGAFNDILLSTIHSVGPHWFCSESKDQSLILCLTVWIILCVRR